MTLTYVLENKKASSSSIWRVHTKFEQPRLYSSCFIPQTRIQVYKFVIKVQWPWRSIALFLFPKWSVHTKFELPQLHSCKCWPWPMSLKIDRLLFPYEMYNYILSLSNLQRRLPSSWQSCPRGLWTKLRPDEQGHIIISL